MDTPFVVLLIRHARTQTSGTRLDGRLPDIVLSDRGHEELSRLRLGLVNVPVDAVYTSPLARARETASAIAIDHHVPINVADDLNEMDFGNWTGRPFDSLALDPDWHTFNARRASTAAPNGEHARNVQRRVVRWLKQLPRRHPTGTVAAVSHAEVIRSAILWCTGRSLDDFHDIAIDTASVSAVSMSPTPRLLFVNATEKSDVKLGSDACLFP
jgi:probable phosphoglycerate mutase